ncbi:BnaA09g01670D [Brassica napus]|uniref:BnaA09g01670D protein n=3 Tax=Brassica TaxID=3705 RepID=A0A078IEZ6_BRANA|nr:BnaA09g01670D [Brassica napus]
MRQVLKDSAEEVNVGAQRLMELNEKVTREDEVDLEKEISELEKLFQEIGLKISNHSQIK